MSAHHLQVVVLDSPQVVHAGVVPPELTLECMASPRLLTEDQAEERIAEAKALVANLYAACPPP